MRVGETGSCGSCTMARCTAKSTARARVEVRVEKYPRLQNTPMHRARLQSHHPHLIKVLGSARRVAAGCSQKVFTQTRDALVSPTISTGTPALYPQRYPQPHLRSTSGGLPPPSATSCGPSLCYLVEVRAEARDSRPHTELGAIWATAIPYTVVFLLCELSASGCHRPPAFHVKQSPRQVDPRTRRRPCGGHPTLSYGFNHPQPFA